MAHTGENIRKLSFDCLFSLGVGECPEDVPYYIHLSTPNEGRNMLKAWEPFEGAGCVFHREQNFQREALTHKGIRDVIKKVKGICAQFHRSDKVSITWSTCFLCMFLFDMLAWSVSL